MKKALIGDADTARSQTFFAPPQTPLPGARDAAKIKSDGDGHYIYLQTQFGEDRCPQTHKHTQTHR